MQFSTIEQVVWFRDWQPDENTIDTICKELEGKRFEFYNLTLNVTKVERGIIVKIYRPQDFVKLSNILKQPITFSWNTYTIENKVLPQIIKTKLIIV